MDALSANEAKSQFGDMLLKAQRAPVQINKNGKPVAVVMSMEDYEGIEAMKLQLLQSRAITARMEIESATTMEGDSVNSKLLVGSELIDGDSFFDALESGKLD